MTAEPWVEEFYRRLGGLFVKSRFDPHLLRRRRWLVVSFAVLGERTQEGVVSNSPG
jgi:hypothetical protein